MSAAELGGDIETLLGTRQFAADQLIAATLGSGCIAAVHAEARAASRDLLERKRALGVAAGRTSIHWLPRGDGDQLLVAIRPVPDSADFPAGDPSFSVTVNEVGSDFSSRDNIGGHLQRVHLAEYLMYPGTCSFLVNRSEALYDYGDSSRVPPAGGPPLIEGRDEMTWFKIIERDDYEPVHPDVPITWMENERDRMMGYASFTAIARSVLGILEPLGMFTEMPISKPDRTDSEWF